MLHRNRALGAVILALPATVAVSGPAVAKLVTGKPEG